MKTQVLSRSGLVVVVATFLVLAQPGKAQEQPPPELVNVQVFTGLSYDEVRAEMTQIRDQLGARCRYCHLLEANDETNYVPETAMKQVARQMIRMVRVLNEQEPFKSGDKKVNCATCHKGSPHIPIFVPGGRETWVPRD